MTNMQILKHEARQATTFRGHDMSRFHNFNATRAMATCKKCRRSVIVNTHPMPNDIEIGGEAVAVNCPS